MNIYTESIILLQVFTLREQGFTPSLESQNLMRRCTL